MGSQVHDTTRRKELLRAAMMPVFDQMLNAVIAVVDQANGSRSVEEKPDAEFDQTQVPVVSQDLLVRALGQALWDNMPEVSHRRHDAKLSTCADFAMASACDRMKAASWDTKSTAPLDVTFQTKKHTTVVCRHWKNKGHCRMGEACKFMHPTNKRGVGPAIPRTNMRETTSMLHGSQGLTFGPDAVFSMVSAPSDVCHPSQCCGEKLPARAQVTNLRHSCWSTRQTAIHPEWCLMALPVQPFAAC